MHVTTLGRNRGNSDPTGIDGIERSGDGEYAVTFTLYLDAGSPDEANDLATRFRNAVAAGNDPLPGVRWHLHDHDGC